MSISRQFHFNKPIQFQINSIHFDSISIHYISIRLQLNSISIQFDSISFQFNSTSWKLIIWGLEGSPPTASRKLQFLTKTCNQKIMIFRRPPDLDFSDFSGGQKTIIFHYKNNRFWSFFGRNLRILDLDTKMSKFHMIFRWPKNEHF